MRKLGRCGKLRGMRSTLKSKRSESHAQIQPFVDLQRWMQSKSSRSTLKVCKILDPAHFHDTGRGMRTRKKLKSGDTIVSIPGECLITMDTVLNSDVGAIIAREDLKFSPQQLLTIFLLTERHKGPASEWWSYIATLPPSYSTVLYWSPSEVDLLPPDARAAADEAIVRFNSASSKISSFFHSFMSNLHLDISQEVVRWAWSTVNTRSVYLVTRPHPSVTLDPKESHMALAPFLDMLNHSDSAQISAGFNTITGSYDIITYNSYAKYDQVFISYGSHDNAKLLLDYGFALPHNINCSYGFTLENIKTLVLKIVKTTGEWSKKLKIFQEANLNGKMLCSREGCSWSLINAAKMFCLTWDQLSQSKRVLIGESVNEENDIAARKLLETLLSDALKDANTNLVDLENYNGGQRSDHFSMLVCLAQDDVDILKTSMALLPAR